MPIDRQRDAGGEDERRARPAPRGRSAPRAAIQFAIHAPASPPATASGGSTNTKCRMPLYIAGRAMTVDGDRQDGGERDSEIDRARARR